MAKEYCEDDICGFIQVLDGVTGIQEEARWEPFALAEGSNASALREGVLTLIVRFGAGNPGLRAHLLKMKRFFRWTEGQLPNAEAVGSHQSPGSGKSGDLRI